MLEYLGSNLLIIRTWSGSFAVMSSDPNRPPVGHPGGPSFNSQFVNMNIGAQPFVPNVQAQPFVPVGPHMQRAGYGPNYRMQGN